MLSITLVLICILGIIHLVNYRNLLMDAKETLQILAENNGVFPGMEEEKERTDPPPLPENMNPEEPFQTRYFSILTDSDGSILHTDFDRIAAVDEGSAQEYVEELLHTGKKEGFTGRYRFNVSEKADTRMYIFLDCSKALGTFQRFLFSSILIGLVGLIMVGILVWFFSGRVVRPFVENYEKQKRFITDAGHEIKTPLTIIEADLSVLEFDLEENEWTEDIRRQTSRLKDLTNDLVYLARAEEMGEKQPVEIFNLSEVAEEAAESFRSGICAQGKKLETKIEPGLTLNGERKSVERLFSILLDNALKYSTEGGTIRFNVGRKGKNIVVEVLNPCAPITREQTEKLFDRFYRTDASRNSETGGHGIGLSIARAIAEKHGGKITASTTDGKSLRIQVIM